MRISYHVFYCALVALLALAARIVHATPMTPPVVEGGSHTLAEALNADGTVRAGATGSFDARQFRMSTAPDGRPVFQSTGTAGAGDERWQAGFTLPVGANSSVMTVVRSGTDIYIGGEFTTVGTVVANHVAKWNGTSWSALGTGFDNAVYALALAPNGDLYAAGMFRRAGPTIMNNVARWNGSTWNALGNGTAVGTYTAVFALAVGPTGILYVGGGFGTAGGLSVNSIAQWDGTAWSALGTGMSGSVNALAIAPNGDLYVGGGFRAAGIITANNLAKWNGSAWSSVGTGIANGTSGRVNALAVAPNGSLYVGGNFTYAGGIAANSVAVWDGSYWSTVGAGISTSTSVGISEEVQSLALATNGDLYIGGLFARAGGTVVNNVARWNGSTWNSLGGTDRPTTALAAGPAGDMFIGGHFTLAGGVIVNSMGRWTGTAWVTLGPGTGQAPNQPVYAVAIAPNGDVYVGGRFTAVGSVAANYVAKWNGSGWSALGSGVTNGQIVYALALAPNGDLYIGGLFARAGGTVANNVARWNGTSWSALGTGVSGEVYALAVTPTGTVYAGGLFANAGGLAVNSVAYWNGTAWSGLNGGIRPNYGTGEWVYALALAPNGDLYIGGHFDHVGGVAADGVARWNGSTWNALGAGLVPSGGWGTYVYALALAPNGDLYAGGDFSTVSSSPAREIAKWNGSTWSALGSGLPGQYYGQIVHALALAPNGDLYIGGLLSSPNVIRWDGTSWSALGTGLDNAVYALGMGSNGKLYAGGIFAAVGDQSKVTSMFAVYDPNAPLATAGRATAGTFLFPNPAHGTVTFRRPAEAPRRPLVLVDAQGRVVRHYPAPTGPEALLDVRGLPAGVYLLQDGQQTQRLVVE